ncbi:hypothetical protein SUGI_0585370 [Cryptomeria japonica]|uniref:purple acid phosphatase 4 n=1 Tax=Cryptomeria japonica TaxID=3369 RepID=UPI00241469C2|nr:purple acid phosphatase 4 [Cryptomeria japonica]GLJ29682.1 hypothetical protein SUGI_0585370 [Cryptomeria japonica]
MNAFNYWAHQLTNTIPQGLSSTASFLSLHLLTLSFMMDLFRKLAWILVLMLLLCFWATDSDCSLQEDIYIARKMGNSLNFLVVGDWGRKGLFNQSQVAVQMGRIGEELGIDFVISTGDNFYENGLTDTEDPSFAHSFSEIYTAKSLQTQWYSVLGNHDYRGDVLAQLSPSLRSRDPRWYCERSFILNYTIQPQFGDLGSVDFFFVDTNPFVDEYWEPSEQTYDWRGVLPRENYIKQHLEDLTNALVASRATWKIVIGHHGIRSIGSHGDTTELVQHLLPILEVHGVDAYMNGHDHCLEHISSLNSPLEFLTSGGGSEAYRGIIESADMKGVRFFHDGQGFMSMQITSTSLHAKFYDVDGNLIHHLDLLKDQHFSY